MNYCMGDFGASTELTEISPALLKGQMGSIESVKDFITNNGVQIVMASVLILGVMALMDNKKAKR